MTDHPRPQHPDRPSPEECYGDDCMPGVLETRETQRAEFRARITEWLGSNPAPYQPRDEVPRRTRLVLDTTVSLG